MRQKTNKIYSLLANEMRFPRSNETPFTLVAARSSYLSQLLANLTTQIITFLNLKFEDDDSAVLKVEEKHLKYNEPRR